MSTEIYAYQTALKTLKERCDYLQSKLDLVEEENCQLKLRLSQDETKNTSKSILDQDQSQLQISLLTEQKAKLNQQIQLITLENQKLWTRLSKFASGNDNFDSKISIRDDNHKYLDGNISYTGNHSDLEISKITVLPEGSKESLEEISLKLNTLIMDKKGVSNFPGSIDLFVYKNLMQLENCAFSYSGNNLQLLNSFKDHIMKLRQFKQILNNNKNDLTSAVNVLKAFQKNKCCNDCGKTFSKTCDGSTSSGNKLSNCKDHLNDVPILQFHEFGTEATEDLFQKLEKICPLCGVKFSGSSEQFLIHVSDHFSDDENEITNNFEMLP